MDSRTPGQIIGELTPGKFAKLGRISPAGSLEARRLTTGTAFYWRVTIDGKTDRVAIGLYDASAPPKSLTPTAKGYSVQAAIRAAEKLAQDHHANMDGGGYRGLIEAKREAKRLADAQKDEAAKHTLQRLMDAYCEQQKSTGRTSYKDAASIFRLHVSQPWPKLAELPANEVEPEQVADMMRRLMELGHGRTANKLRSYLSSAYSMAKAAKSKPTIPVTFKAFRVRLNPAAETAPDESSNKPDKNPLSAAELRLYWQIIKPMPGFVGAALRLHLLTGGQRLEQLVRLKTSDVTEGAVVIYDGKGRPGKPSRPHTVPLIPMAAAALAAVKPKGIYAISTDEGKTHLSASTLSEWAAKAAIGLIPTFATKRVRSGVETLLASARIGSEIRGRLQSHGVGGVQARHYDGHDYLDEKRHALETLFALLDAPETSNVIQFKAS